MCVWHFAGGHGVATNHTLAHDHYLDAHDAGQWRAPHALAMTHQQGWGVQPNCSKAQRYIQTFIKERSSWTYQMDEAVLALDAGLLCSICYWNYHALHCSLRLLSSGYLWERLSSTWWAESCQFMLSNAMLSVQCFAANSKPQSAPLAARNKRVTEHRQVIVSL